MPRIIYFVWGCIIRAVWIFLSLVFFFRLCLVVYPGKTEHRWPQYRNTSVLQMYYVPPICTMEFQSYVGICVIMCYHLATNESGDDQVTSSWPRVSLIPQNELFFLNSPMNHSSRALLYWVFRPVVLNLTLKMLVLHRKSSTAYLPYMNTFIRI